MIYELMKECNNYFDRGYVEEFDSIEADGIVGSFKETYKAGMYVIIEGSYLNDGAYKVSSVTPTKITVTETLNIETVEDETVYIIASTPPKSFIDLATEIESKKDKSGVSSEKLGDYSISFKDGGSWVSAYSKKIGQYRKVFNEILNWCNYGN